VCDSTPLKPLVSYCSSVLEFVESLQDTGNAVSVPRKHGRKAKDSSPESVASTSDFDPSGFSGSSVQEMVKQLKMAAEPLNLLIAKTEEELAKESQSDNSSAGQNYEALASKLKTQYAESVRALSAVRRTKALGGLRNCTVDVERIHMSSSEQIDLAESKHVSRTGASHASEKVEAGRSSQISNSINSSSRASKADIEAKRDLHKQMLSSKDASLESSSNESSSSSSGDDDSSTSEKSDDSDDDEYDPKQEIRQVKHERGRERRTTVKKQKMRAGNQYICFPDA